MTYLTTYRIHPYKAFIHIIQDHLQEMTTLLNPQDLTKKLNQVPSEINSRNGVKIWNSLPCKIRHLSKNNFKIKIHNIPLQRLSEENDYIDLSVLITKIY